MEKIQELKTLINTVEEDCDKFFEKGVSVLVLSPYRNEIIGNKAAGVRARKTLQEIKKIAQDLRMEIQDSKVQVSKKTEK
eukprot:jgi/Galph1/446/GphlegSOOS_G5259.1